MNRQRLGAPLKRAKPNLSGDLTKGSKAPGITVPPTLLAAADDRMIGRMVGIGAKTDMAGRDRIRRS
jgi:hypothetical protein